MKTIILLIAFYCQPTIDSLSCEQQVKACFGKYSELYPDMNKKEIVRLCFGDFQENNGKN